MADARSGVHRLTGPVPVGFGAAMRGLGLLVILLVGAFAARADTHGIAMHGEPKYPPGFAHFDYVNPDAPKGGRLRLAAIGGFDSLNPFIIKGEAAKSLGLTFESLMARSQDEPFSLYGLLAGSVDVAPDRSWITFTLRPEARFSDGKPVTVDDVVFTYETLRSKGRPNHRLFYRQVASVTRPGPNKVKFDFGSGENRELALILGLMPILPKHFFAGRDFERTGLDAIPGSGPYEVVELEPGRLISYRRRSDYWGLSLAPNRGRYNFDRIDYTYYRDAGVALMAFKSGDYDLRFEHDPARWATLYDFPAVAAGDVVKEEVIHGLTQGMRGFAFNTRRPMFADPRVRAALAYAFDFDWANRSLFHGAYRQSASYFSNSDLAAVGPPSAGELALLEPWRGRVPDEVFGPAYAPPFADGPAGLRRNLKQAFKLLTEAGWLVRDGRLVGAKSGRPMTFEILLADPRDERIALAFAQNLERLGITARIRTADAAQYERRRRAFDFDIILTDWYQSLSPGSEQLYYWGSVEADIEGSRNYVGVRDPAVDAMVGHLTAARTRPELIAATRALDRILLWSHYVVPLYHDTVERVAYWHGVAHPAVVPLYGHQLTTWWSIAP